MQKGNRFEKQDGAKQDNLKQNSSKQNSLKQNNSKQNSSKQNNVKQNNVKQNNVIQNSTQGNNAKGTSARGNRAVNGTDYRKANKRREEYEDYQEFEDFDNFVKATGWKKSGNSASVKAGNKIQQKAQLRKGQSKASVQGTQRKAAENGLPSKRQKQGFQGEKADQFEKKQKGQERSTHTGKISAQDGAKQRTSQTSGQPGTARTKKGTCIYQRACGGCKIQHVSYGEHLAEKQKEVEKLLKGYGKIEPIIGMEHPDHYRHKVHVVFDHDKKGNPISGVYEEGTHRVIAVESCLIHNKKADAIIATIRGMLKSFKILTYDEDSGYGLLRHVLIRTGYHSGEIMVVLVLASPIMPSKNNFVKALRKEHPEITTVVLNVNDKQTSMVLGEKEQVIYGKSFIEDSLCGKTFRISPKSFYQVNPSQTEILYKKAIQLAGLTGNETVIDAYCGTGTIGLIAADHAKRVIGVELNKDAVRDAAVNAKRNDARNIEFYQNDAGVFLNQMVTKGESADVVFMDPPRAGSTPEFLEAVAALSPKRVVYISCNPVTLARDLECLTKKGYKVQTVIPVDMFPWTNHSEVVVLLQRKG
jgi:23S rRNA (uracil1939-C5)-methyltransferase